MLKNLKTDESREEGKIIVLDFYLYFCAYFT